MDRQVHVEAVPPHAGIKGERLLASARDVDVNPAPRVGYAAEGHLPTQKLVELDRCRSLIDAEHLARVKALVARISPIFVSDHLSWSAVDGAHLNDLLPLPYDEGALNVVAANVSQVQDTLDRRILVENPSRYLAFNQSTMDEPEFLARLVARTGCGILLDINNIHVSAANLGFDAHDYLARTPGAMIEEIHLAGFLASPDCPELLIDTHSRPVAEEVWSLYEKAVAMFGPRATLIEWDSEVPALPVLVGEMQRAQKVLGA